MPTSPGASSTLCSWDDIATSHTLPCLEIRKTTWRRFVRLREVPTPSAVATGRVPNPGSDPAPGLRPWLAEWLLSGQ